MIENYYSALPTFITPDTYCFLFIRLTCANRKCVFPHKRLEQLVCTISHIVLYMSRGWEYLVKIYGRGTRQYAREKRPLRDWASKNRHQTSIVCWINLENLSVNFTLNNQCAKYLEVASYILSLYSSLIGCRKRLELMGFDKQL